MNSAKYGFVFRAANIFSTLCLAVCAGCIVLELFSIMLFNKGLLIWPIIVFVIAFVARLPMGKVMRRAIEEGEYDSNGFYLKFNTVSKLSRKEREALAKQQLSDAERLLSSSALKKMTRKGSEDPEKDLNIMIGLKNVKQVILEMAARMEFDKKNHVSRETGHHVVFMGNPGTGKTTVARIYTGFLYRYGYIKKNQCIEIDGNFLRGQTPGETTQKTRAIIQKAIGGVLFIDEAYSINDGGQEAIATIIKEMEDRRTEFVLILAGYTDEMRMLISANPGFRSRINDYIEFPDYMEQELLDIFQQMAHSMNFCVDAWALDRFLERITRERKTQYFGNARTVRNVLDETINKHSFNLKNGIIPPDKRFVLTGEDVPVQIKNII